MNEARRAFGNFVAAGITTAVEALSGMAVGAQQLQRRREVMIRGPLIDELRNTDALDALDDRFVAERALKAMHVSVVVNVVELQIFGIG